MSFIVKEAFRSFSRAKLSSFIALLSLVVGIVLLKISFLTIYVSSQLENKIKENLTLVAFLSDDVSDALTVEIGELIRSKKQVERLEFISKDQAAATFIKETGEDFRQALGYNPLPASYTIYLKKDIENLTDVEAFKLTLLQVKGIADVQFQAGLFDKALKLISKARLYIWSLTAILGLAAFYIVLATLKLIMINRKTEIETMKLVGASIAVIRLPIILNGLLLGITAGVISFGLTLISLNLLDQVLMGVGDLYQIGLIALPFSLGIGALIGFLCSVIVTRRINLQP